MSEKRNPPSPEPRHARSASGGNAQGLRASILAGPEVSVIEISRQELLVESDVRLTPGAGICLNVSIAGANYLAGGRITKVDAALAGGQVRYRASVKLDNEMPAFDLVQPQPAVEPAVPEPPSVSSAPRTAPEPAAAEEPMDHQQTLQMLKTALRSSEAVRKELVEELEAARAQWDAERQALEARVGQVQKSATTAGQQISNAREAERLLAGKYAQEQAAWVKERAALQESARQADARVAQAEAAAKQATGRVDQIQQEARTIQERERAAAARVKELEAGQRALQEAAKKAGELAAKAAHDVAAVRDNEQRLAKRIEEMTGKMDGLLEDQQRQEAELEAAMAMVAAAEQKIGGHEKERRDWAAQKERLSARLQTTEKWCADQQHLLYELQQHLGRASTLLDGWTPQSLDEADGEETAAPKGARKATA